MISTVYDRVRLPKELEYLKKKSKNENSNLILCKLLSFGLNMAINPPPALLALSW